MPKKYSMTRKINLGRYGLQYEAIDICVEGASSWEEAEADLNAERNKIHEAFIPIHRIRLETLNQRTQLTAGEATEREKLISLNNQLPF